MQTKTVFCFVGMKFLCAVLNNYISMRPHRSYLHKPYHSMTSTVRFGCQVTRLFPVPIRWLLNGMGVLNVSVVDFYDIVN